MCALPLFHSVGCVYHTMQANCRSSLKQKTSSSHVQGHTESPPVLGDGKLEGTLVESVPCVTTLKWSALVHAGDGCSSFGGQCELHTYIHT